jgi:glyoxylase-like metal-dependent hydrolase (beta-lactamase superfamily II)
VRAQSAFLTTRDGVVLFDAPPSIGHNLRRAVDEIAAANGVTNTVTHLVYSHHHHDHAGASSIFGDVVRVGHKETKRLLARDNDPGRPGTWACREVWDLCGLTMFLTQTRDCSVARAPCWCREASAVW